MNIPLLRRVQAYILEEPKRFRMDTWADLDMESPCGTTLCIAGAAVALKLGLAQNVVLRALTRDGNLDILYKALGISGSHDIEGLAAQTLELTPEQAQSLFYNFQWPQPFRSLSIHAAGAEIRAAIGVARIEHLIQSGT